MMLLKIKIIWSKKLRRAFEAQRLAWSGVQFPGNRVQLILRILAQIAALGKLLAQQSVRVLVNPSLPGAVRIGKVDLDAGGCRQLLMGRHFLALIVGHRKARLCLDPIQDMTESPQGRFSSGIFHPGQHGEQGRAPPAYRPQSGFPPP